MPHTINKSSHQILHVLTYHRVLDKHDPLQPDITTKHQFSFQMGIIKRLFNVIDLEEAIIQLKENRLPKRTIAITFDDGYRDNYTTALPILKKYDLTATFFLISSAIQNDQWLWHDLIIEGIRALKTATIDLSSLGLQQYPISNDNEKLVATQEILRHIKYLPEPQLKQFINDFKSLTSISNNTRFMMSTSEVRELSNEGMGIGSHAVEHYILTTQTPSASRSNIIESKKSIEAMINKPVVLYAYPNGKEKDFNAEHESIIKSTGYLAAFTTCYDKISLSCNDYALPRVSCWPSSRIGQLLYFIRLAWRVR